MSARVVETWRRRRDRREAQAQAEREWVCGGPLVDNALLGGTTGPGHQARLEAELRKRAERVADETRLLAAQDQSLVHLLGVRFTQAARLRKVLLAVVGGPYIQPTYSTAPSSPVVGAIPRLPGSSCTAQGGHAWEVGNGECLFCGQSWLELDGLPR